MLRSVARDVVHFRWRLRSARIHRRAIASVHIAVDARSNFADSHSGLKGMAMRHSELLHSNRVCAFTIQQLQLLTLRGLMGSRSPLHRKVATLGKCKRGDSEAYCGFRNNRPSLRATREEQSHCLSACLPGSCYSKASVFEAKSDAAISMAAGHHSSRSARNSLSFCSSSVTTHCLWWREAICLLSCGACRLRHVLLGAVRYATA